MNFTDYVTMAFFGIMTIIVVYSVYYIAVSSTNIRHYDYDESGNPVDCTDQED